MIAFRASTTANTGSTTASSIVVNLPAGTQTGDLLIFSFTIDNTGSNAAITPPSGFTTISTSVDVTNAALYKLLVFRKTATASEPSNYTFTFDSARRCSAVGGAWSGSSTAINNSSAWKTTVNTSSTATGTVTASPNYSPSYAVKFVASYGSASPNSVSSPGGSFTTRGDTSTSGTVYHNAIVDYRVGDTDAHNAAYPSTTLSQTATNNSQSLVFLQESLSPLAQPVIGWRNTFTVSASATSGTFFGVSRRVNTPFYVIIFYQNTSATVSSFSSTPDTLSFTQIASAQDSGNNTKTEVWKALIPNTNTQTVSITFTAPVTAIVAGYSFRGASSISGAINTASGTTGAPSSSLVTTNTNSQVLTAFTYDSNSAISGISSGDTREGNFALVIGSESMALLKRSSLVPNSGTTVSSSVTTPSTVPWSLVQFEIVSAQKYAQSSGTLLLGGSVGRPEHVNYREAVGTLRLGGSVEGSLDSVSKKSQSKSYMYKIYEPGTGNFLGQWNDVVSDFGYSHEINSAGSAIQVVLARNSDTLAADYDVIANDSNDPIETDDNNQLAAETNTTSSIGPGTNVDLNLDVKIYEFSPEDEDLAGRLVFTGYISKYTSQYGSDEQTIVSIFSYGADLDNWVLEDGDGKTRLAYLSTDPSDIVRDTLDKFNDANGITTYDGTSIDDTDTVVSYAFNVNTELEVVKKCLELAPTDWYFYVDLATNLLHFKERPTVPDHYFYLGKHIFNFDLEKYIEDITNTIYITGGQIAEDIDGNPINFFKKYTDATSISDYRRGLQRQNDERLTVEDSADIIAESTLNRLGVPRYRSSITISNAQYDIRTIKLGQLVGFRNFANFVDSVTMQIVRIDYSPESVTLQLDTLLPSVPKRIEDIKRNLGQSDVTYNPDEPTT